MKILQYAACQWSSILLWSTRKDIQTETRTAKKINVTWYMEVTLVTRAPINIHCRNQRKKAQDKRSSTKVKKRWVQRFWRSAKKHITHSDISKKTSRKAIWKGESHEFVDPAATDTVKTDMKNENWRVVTQNTMNFQFSSALQIWMKPPRSCLCSHREPGLCPGPGGGRLMYWLVPLAHHFHTNLHMPHLNNCV